MLALLFNSFQLFSDSDIFTPFLCLAGSAGLVRVGRMLLLCRSMQN